MGGVVALVVWLAHGTQAAREAAHNEKATVAAKRIQALEEKLKSMQHDFDASAESLIRLSEENEELQIMRDRLLRRLEVR